MEREPDLSASSQNYIDSYSERIQTALYMNHMVKVTQMLQRWGQQFTHSLTQTQQVTHLQKMKKSLKR